jgi:hypothetical protein
VYVHVYLLLSAALNAAPTTLRLSAVVIDWIDDQGEPYGGIGLDLPTL